ncbi:MAG: hypothetical protein IPK26_26625 [Planctomycetes bacterium]|nr:hypothetical protein [Planctomycetota bacterium]
MRRRRKWNPACGCRGHAAATFVRQSPAPHVRFFPLLLTASAVAQSLTWSSPNDAPSARQAHAMAYDAGRGRTVLFGGATGATFGLDDTWELDRRGWIRTSPTTVPPGRVGHGMAWDPRRGVAVMFGGFTHQQGNANALDDTWEWTGRDWRQVQVAMPTLGNVSMCWSGIEQEVLVFGGRYGCKDFCAPSSDTYSFNGTRWLWRTQAGPGPRENCGMVWVPPVQRVLLVGGLTGTPPTTATQETWAWNGSAWSQATNSGTVPGSTHAASLTWDGGRNRLVLIGGNSGAFGQEFTWLGNVVNSATVQWTVQSNLDPTTQIVTPEPRHLGAAVFDDARQRTVFFGGRSLASSTVLGSLHELPTTGSWTTRAPVATRPPARIYTEMAYDQGRGLFVLAGGWNGAPMADTWTFDGVTWTSYPTHTHLAARRHQAMFYCETTGEVVLFGGGNGGSGNFSVFGDLHRWHGNGWTSTGASGPWPADRSGHDMVWDRARGVAVMFGGWNGFGNLGDTWEWNPAGTIAGTWVQTSSAVAPPARNSHKMAYDVRNQRTVLFGGSDPNGQFLGDTWTYTGGPLGWTQQAPPTSPPRRWNHVMDYDPARQVVVLTGGYGNPQCGNFCASHLHDVWEYDGVSWRPRTGPNALFAEPVAGVTPRGREGAAFGYDTRRQTFVQFGGGPGPLTSHDDETWQLHSVVDRYAPGQSAGAFQIRCTKVPVAGRDIAFTFPSASGFAWVAIHLGVSPYRTHVVDPPVICGSQGWFYGLQPIVAQIGGNPGNLQFGLPAWTLGMGLGIQALTFDAPGQCFLVSDALALTVQGP